MTILIEITPESKGKLFKQKNKIEELASIGKISDEKAKYAKQIMLFDDTCRKIRQNLTPINLETACKLLGLLDIQTRAIHLSQNITYSSIAQRRYLSIRQTVENSNLFYQAGGLN